MTNIPRKLSVADMNADPSLRVIGPRLRVSVDGKYLGSCQSYDMDAGTAERFVAGGDGWNVETVTGKVEVSLADAA